MDLMKQLEISKRTIWEEVERIQMQFLQNIRMERIPAVRICPQKGIEIAASKTRENAVRIAEPATGASPPWWEPSEPSAGAGEGHVLHQRDLGKAASSLEGGAGWGTEIDIQGEALTDKQRRRLHDMLAHGWVHHAIAHETRILTRLVNGEAADAAAPA